MSNVVKEDFQTVDYLIGSKGAKEMGVWASESQMKHIKWGSNVVEEDFQTVDDSMGCKLQRC